MKKIFRKKQKKSNFKSYSSIFLILAFILTTGQGCIIKFKDKNEVPVTFDGGVHISKDKGKTWLESNNLFSLKCGESINTVDVVDFTFDPNNENTIYLLTKSNGVYYSLDQANSWMKITSLGDKVADISIDPKNECTVYAGVSNKIMKSTNCMRSFKEIFHTEPSSRKITSLAVDYNNSNIIYASNSSEMLKSLDAGSSWQVGNRFGGGIRDIKIRRVRGMQVIYVVTEIGDVHKSINNGVDWENIAEGLINNTKRSKIVFDDFLFDDSGSDSLIFMDSSGVRRSSDGGENWGKVNVISGSSKIYSFAVNPEDRDNIFYTTNKTFYESVDGGENWITSDLAIGPRVAKKLIIDKINPNLMFIGAYQIVPETKK